jgi:hypothetical protein
MQVVHSSGQIEELGQRAIDAGHKAIASRTPEDFDAHIAASKAFNAAVAARLAPNPSEREELSTALQALLADAMERGERVFCHYPLTISHSPSASG